MSLISRKVETKQLTKILASDKAEFLVVYGRRRVGKTYLIHKYFSEANCVFFEFSGLRNGTLKQHLQIFTEKFSQCFYSNLKIQPPKTWLEAFKLFSEELKKQNGNKKMVMFIDELPWLATPRSGLLEAIDYYWNTVWSKYTNFCLIACGSAASWMIKNIINNKGGLHNRRTALLHLKPLSLSETKSYLQSRGIELSKYQLVILYMSIGGIPFYLDAINKSLSVTQNISHLCFEETGILFNEFKTLFQSLFKHAESHEELIKIMSKHRYGIERNLLIKKSKLLKSGGRFKERLHELEEAGFIAHYQPQNTAKKGTYYRLQDEYSYFYLTWIEPAKKQLLRNNYWEMMTSSPQYQTWCGYAFESFCLKHIAEIIKSLGLSTLAIRAYPWRYIPNEKSQKGAQIDLVIERMDDVTTLCEIKFSHERYVIDKSYAANLQNKINVFKEQTNSNKAILINFITMHGILLNEHAKAIVHQSISIDDILAVGILNE